jgi:NAD(P)-dependent dehydrogenase (short-subunit alcohol dehydrogenase family)
MSAIFGIKRLLEQKWNPPKPAKGSFEGRTILLTGASSGLGFEAGKKIIALHADTLIITARTESKGQATKQQLEEWLKTQIQDSSAKSTAIVPMVLSMDSFAAVQEFASKLKAQYPAGIDGAILNAGALMAKYAESSDGWEDTIQVNALSTFLLGILILPLLVIAADSSKNPTCKPHLSFVSSGTAWTVQPGQMKTFMASETPLEALSEQKNFPGGMAGGAGQYARSKLTLEYAVRHLAASSALKGADGRPKVIVNTVCPGMCKSDLGRNIGKVNPMVKLVQWLLFSVVARSAEDGANVYVTGLEQGEETHGEMWKNDRVFEVGPMLSTAEGKEFGEKMWSEILHVMLKADASTKTFLG